MDGKVKEAPVLGNGARFPAGNTACISSCLVAPLLLASPAFPDGRLLISGDCMTAVSVYLDSGSMTITAFVSRSVEVAGVERVADGKVRGKAADNSIWL